MLIYQKYVTYRGKQVHLNDLKPNSHKKISITCPNCGVVFERYFFKFKQTGSFLCQKCSIVDKLSLTMDIGTKNNKLTIIAQSDKSGKSICKCDCGNTTEVFNKDFRSGRVKSCGCLRSENMKKHAVHLTGSEHGMWKGGVTSERQSLMTKKLYKDWKLAIFEHDNFTCLKCNCKNDLNTHHIFNYNDNKEKSLDLDNGVTLCGKCHRKFHSIYGRKNTNKKQFDQFILNP